MKKELIKVGITYLDYAIVVASVQASWNWTTRSAHVAVAAQGFDLEVDQQRLNSCLLS